MESLFLDTNILLDVILKREPFFKDSKRVWQLVEEGQAEGWIAAISFNNIHYILRKLTNSNKALEAVRTLHKIFRTAKVDEEIMGEAIAMNFSDFEDAIQYSCAKHTGNHWFLTRNVDDFPIAGKLKSITPKDFLLGTL